MKGFGRLMLYSLKMCLIAVPRRKAISNHFREAVVVNHSGKGYKFFSKHSRVHHCTVKKIIYKWKHTRQLPNRHWGGCSRKSPPKLDCAVKSLLSKKKKKKSSMTCLLLL